MPFFTHEVVPSYPLREIDDVVSPISDLGACLRDIVNFGPGEACGKRPHGAGAYTEDFPQAIVLSDGPGHAREGGITMRDAFPAPASQMARFFRCFVIAVAGAQTAFWLYTFRLIYVNANPMGDGFEFVAVVPFGFVFFALVVPSLVLGAGNTGREFDLETNYRIAEFKFIHWRGGPDTIRQNSIFKDFFLLADGESANRKYL